MFTIPARTGSAPVLHAAVFETLRRRGHESTIAICALHNIKRLGMVCTIRHGLHYDVNRWTAFLTATCRPCSHTHTLRLVARWRALWLSRSTMT